MENLKIEATQYTPEINFDAVNGILNIAGKSYPENTFEYYKPIVDWVDEYLQSVKNDRKIVVNLDLEYLNSSSLKAYFDLFDLLEIAHNDGKNIEIKWIFDEENDVEINSGDPKLLERLNANLSGELLIESEADYSNLVDRKVNTIIGEYLGGNFEIDDNQRMVWGMIGDDVLFHVHRQRTTSFFINFIQVVLRWKYQSFFGI